MSVKIPTIPQLSQAVEPSIRHAFDVLKSWLAGVHATGGFTPTNEAQNNIQTGITSAQASQIAADAAAKDAATANTKAKAAATTAIWTGITGDAKPDDNATVGAISGTNLIKSDGATVLGDSDVLNTYVPTGSNLLPNSDFPDYSLQGWTFLSNTTPFSYGVNLNSTWAVAGVNTVWVHQSDATTPDDYYLNSDSISVKPGTVYGFSAYILNFWCAAYVFIFWYDSAGTYISTSNTSVGGLNWLADSGVTPTIGNSLSNYTRAYCYGTAPSNAAYGKGFVGRHATTAGRSGSYIFFCHPQFEEYSASQTAPAPYNSLQGTVNTSNIVPYGASQSLASYVGTATPGAGLDLASVTITTTVGSAVLVLANVQSILTTGFTSTTNQLAFTTRDAVTIGGAPFGYSSAAHLAGSIAFAYLDAPGVGTFTYHFKAATAGTYRDVALQVIELKR